MTQEIKREIQFKDRTTSGKIFFVARVILVVIVLPVSLLRAVGAKNLTDYSFALILSAFCIDFLIRHFANSLNQHPRKYWVDGVLILIALGHGFYRFQVPGYFPGIN